MSELSRVVFSNSIRKTFASSNTHLKNEFSNCVCGVCVAWCSVRVVGMVGGARVCVCVCVDLDD